MSKARSPIHSRNNSLGEGPQFASPFGARSSSDFSMTFQASLEQQSSMDLGDSPVDGAGPGVGNLADELADAFSDSGDEAEDNEEKYSPPYDEPVCENKSSIQNYDSRLKSPRSDSSIQLSNPSSSNLDIPTSQQRNHQRKISDYDGSDYGSSSDLDGAGLAPSVISKMDAVESLARRGADDSGLPEDDIFTRVTGELRDLASQSSVESSASRLITAHSAIATHLVHQTRQIHSLTFPLLSPMAPTPSSDVVDDIVPLLVSLAEAVPKPSTVAYESLSALHSMTAELVRTLSYLSDTLHMSRQTTATATRRLRSARELVAEMRRDDELREEGEVWLARGNWGERLKKRECASVCGDVMGGFEAVCNGWRERLAAQERSAA